MVVVIAGNPKPMSRTRAAAELIAEKLTGAAPSDVIDVIDPLGAGLLGWGDPAVARAKATVLEAARWSSRLRGTRPPMRCSSTLPRPVRARRTRIENDSPVMLGASLAHSLAPELTLRPVLVEIGASCLVPSLYLIDSEYEPTEALDAVGRDRKEVYLMSNHEFVTASDEAFNQQLLRRAFSQFPSGVTAFCGKIAGRPDGMAASSFTSVSVDPALVSVCVANTSSTWNRLAGLPTLGLSVLSAEHGPVARALAGKDSDRFAEVEWAETESGAVFVHGASLWMETVPFQIIDAGDHQIVVLEIRSLLINPDVEPMLFHRSAFREFARIA